jgi:hypothetical protein
MTWLLRLTPQVILTLLLTSLTFNFWHEIPTAQAQVNTLTPVFILLAPGHNDTSTMTQLQTMIKSKGGRVTHTFPFQALIANVPAGMTAQLAELSGIAAVFTEVIELSTMDVYGTSARRLAAVWNSLLSPQLAPEMPLTTQDHSNDPNDALTAPDLPSPHEIGAAASGSITPGYYETSKFMAGSVAVGLVLVESNGQVDPSTEDWTDDEKQLVFNEIVAACNWWTELDPRANLSFIYDDHFSNPLPTGVEPITRSYADQQYWLADAMDALGYNSSSYFTGVRDYTNNLRAAYHTDWAFTIFVVNSAHDADNRFSDSYFAYAFLGGPFFVMTSGNNGYGPYNMDAVAAHEMGHIFLALDQYYNAAQSCSLRSGYLYVENQNSQYGGCTSNVNSIMRGQISPYSAKVIDPYAAGQIGWRDSDGDNIFDPLDTPLPVSIDHTSTEDNRVTVSGAAEIVPYPSPNSISITINTLTGVKYRFDAGDWQPATTAADGAFDGATENYQFITTALAPGLHNLEVAAVDSAGNVSDKYATETIAILDPIDGGLNTDLYLSPNNDMSASQVTTIRGVSYDMGDGLIVNVEYRINDSAWQPAQAEDGAFDSNYEPFNLTFAPSSLGAGPYRLEARATNSNGYVEVNVASEEIKIAETHPIFLPVVINNR